MIYDNIKAICEIRGISVGKIEKELNLSNGIISKWNESEPGIRKVQKVADYLGVPIEELLKELPDEEEKGS